MPHRFMWGRVDFWIIPEFYEQKEIGNYLGGQPIMSATIKKKVIWLLEVKIFYIINYIYIYYFPKFLAHI